MRKLLFIFAFIFSVLGCRGGSAARTGSAGASAAVSGAGASAVQAAGQSVQQGKPAAAAQQSVRPAVAKNGKPTIYNIKVVGEFPHSTEYFTQGLFFWNGSLYESAGGYGRSVLVKYAPGGSFPSERVEKIEKFGRQYFMEGSVVLGDKLYLLTWMNNLILTYDAASLKWLKSTAYGREGWGLTTDGKYLITSDGSSQIFYLDPQNGFQTVRTLDVTYEGKPLQYLNELEYIDGKIWANVFTYSAIVIINPATGVVEGMINCSSLTSRMQHGQEDVLNGIAQDPSTGRIYVTGKNWPSIFEITLE